MFSSFTRRQFATNVSKFTQIPQYNLLKSYTTTKPLINTQQQQHFATLFRSSNHSFNKQPLHKYATTATATFGTAASYQPPTEEDLLRHITQQSGHEYEANAQEKAILGQIIEKYGLDSDECKEFSLTTSDLSPIDEVRMLSPCGVHYTNSIFYSILFFRFRVGDIAEAKSREAGIQYEKCLVAKASDELHFWTKAREMAQISAGFVQSAKDHEDRQKDEDERQHKNQEINKAKDEAQKLEEVANKRVEL